MPGLAAFGARSARAFGFGAGVSGATFVTAQGYAPASGPNQSVSFSGASEGNLALVIVSLATSNATPSGWTLVSYYTDGDGSKHATYSRTLTAGDISTGSVTFTNVQGNASLVMAAFYAGTTTAAVVSTAYQNGGTSLAIGGFTKSGASKAILSYFRNALVDSIGTLTVPTGTTARIAPFDAASPSAGTGALAAFAATASYINGAAMTWTGVGNGRATGTIIELT